MAQAERKNFEQADETRMFDRGKLQIVNVSNTSIGRAIFQPGWRWSESVKPIAKTASCQIPYFQYHVSGVLGVRMDDGTELELRPGDVSMLPPGHEAWVVGDEPCVIVDFQRMIDNYAKPK